MPTPHHRKKHKLHQQKYQHHEHQPGRVPGKKKRKAANWMGAIGALLGFAITYFAGTGLIWIVIATIAGLILGYTFGNSMDKA